MAAMLQKEADKLHELAQELTPEFLPESATPNILELAETEGLEGAQALLEVLAAAGEDLEECEICGEPGELALAPESEQPESQLLRPVFLFQPSYSTAQLHPIACKFLCGLCRQIRNTSSLLSEFLAAQTSSDYDLVDGLCEHLCAVNGIETEESSEWSWTASLLSRAYALRVASSAFKFGLLYPDGSKFQAGSPGSAARLALSLLLPDASPEKREAALQRALGNNSDAEEGPSKNANLAQAPTAVLNEATVPDKAQKKQKKRKKRSGDVKDASMSTPKRNQGRARSAKRKQHD